MAADDLSQYLYPLDLTGAAATNKVVGEKQTLNPPPAPEDNDGEITFHTVIPFAAPFYRDSMKITHLATGRALTRGIDWAPAYKFIDASYETENAKGGIYGGILLFDRTLGGQISFDSYQTLGGTWTLNDNKILEILSNRLVDPRSVSWEVISGKPEVFPPIPHQHPITDVTGAKEIIVGLYEIATAVRERTADWLANPPILMDNYYDKDEVDELLEKSPYEVVKPSTNITGTVVIDCLAADVFQFTATGKINWTFTNRPFAAETARFIEVRLKNGGNFTGHTYPLGTVFADGDSDLTVNGTDKLVFELGKDYIDVTVIREMS